MREDHQELMQERMPVEHEAVLADMVALREAARRQAARSVNAILTAAYWEIGRCIVEREQAGQARADYGERLIERRLDNYRLDNETTSARRSPSPGRITSGWCP